MIDSKTISIYGIILKVIIIDFNLFSKSIKRYEWKIIYLFNALNKWNISIYMYCYEVNEQEPEYNNLNNRNIII